MRGQPDQDVTEEEVEADEGTLIGAGDEEYVNLPEDAIQVPVELGVPHAQAIPEAVAVAGALGLAQATPGAAAVVGPGGISIAFPTAQAIVGPQ